MSSPTTIAPSTACPHKFLAVLYVEQKAFLRRIVTRAGVAARDVEDVVHNAFLQIAGALGRFDPKRRLRAWLATIARRTARDHLELRRTTEAPIGLDARRYEPALVDDGTPEALLLEAERRAHVRQLAGECDEVLERAVVREQTWADIASELRIPLSTVQGRLRRARADLDARLRRRPSSGKTLH